MISPGPAGNIHKIGQSELQWLGGLTNGRLLLKTKRQGSAPNGGSVHPSQNLHDTWPQEVDPTTICFSVDVEWAHPVVLDDLRRLFDEAGIVATFFITHEGVLAPGHERGLHPNFRRNGDGYQAFLTAHRAATDPLTESQAQRFVLERTLGFAPEAKGVRTHSLYSDSTLLPMYSALGLQYDCSYDMPFVGGLRPFWKTHDILAIPIYYMDHIDIMTGATDFALECLRLDRPGLKVFDFHPNMIYLNASDDAAYQASKPFYHDPERLLAARNHGRGVRTLLLKLIDHVVARRMPVARLDQINACWRKISHDADTSPSSRSLATCGSKFDLGQADVGEGRP